MILAHSLNGCLRLRAAKNGKTAVVELRSKFFAADWVWCVYRSMPVDKAWDLFLNQCQYHLGASSETTNPGV